MDSNWEAELVSEHKHTKGWKFSANLLLTLKKQLLRFTRLTVTGSKAVVLNLFLMMYPP